MGRWLENHTGTVIAISLTVIAIGSVLASIIGWAVGDDAVAENGWVLALLAGLAGLAIRAGYNVGKRARFEQVEEELARVNTRLDAQAEELHAAQTIMVDVYNLLTDREGVVRQFPRQRST